MINLVSLNISYNNVCDLSPLSNLNKLKILNLSHNKIEKLDNLFNMQSLQFINLENNEISSFLQISHLSSINHFPSLTNICFQSIDKKYTNPICKDASYFKRIYDIFDNNKQIISIDHHRINSHHIQNSIDIILQSVRCNSVTYHNTKCWIPKNYDISTSTNIDVAHDLEFQMAKKKLYGSISTAINESSSTKLQLIELQQS